MGDIAVIGFSFKLPDGIETQSDFWDTLENAKNLMTEWPASRINGKAFHSPEMAKRNKVREIALRLRSVCERERVRVFLTLTISYTLAAGTSSKMTRAHLTLPFSR